MGYEGALVVATLAGVLGVVAFDLLFQPTTGISVSLSADSTCRANTLRYGGGPDGEPMRATNVTLRDGERFAVELPAGEWVARLRAESAEFALVERGFPERPMPEGRNATFAAPPPEPQRWVSESIRGWCYGGAAVETYLARGSGVLVVEYWHAADGGLTIG